MNTQELVEKKCTICLVVKQLSEFGKTTKHKDGLTYYCKACRGIRQKNEKITKIYTEALSKYRSSSASDYQTFSEWILEKGLPKRT
jgi:hypothetical protein